MVFEQVFFQLLEEGWVRCIYFRHVPDEFVVVYVNQVIITVGTPKSNFTTLVDSIDVLDLVVILQKRMLLYPSPDKLHQIRHASPVCRQAQSELTGHRNLHATSV